MSEENKKIITPELEKVGMVREFMQDDDLSDLSELEIYAISAYTACNNKVCPLPWFMDFKKQYLRLRKSKGRMGRQEYENILKGPATYRYSHSDPEIFPDAEVKKPPSWLSKVFKRGQ